MSEIITSSSNKVIKHVKALSVKKYRDEYGEFIIEGIKLVREAVEYSAAISYLLVNAEKTEHDGIKGIIEKAEEVGSNVIYLDGKVFDEISETETPQGVMAIVKKNVFDLEAVLKNTILNVLVLDEVRDPGNMGTIIRTADACGMDAVILSKGCADVYGGKVVRSTMGSIFHIPIITGINAPELICRMNAMGVLTIGADPYGEVPCTGIEKSDKNAIIIGNESNGLSDEVKASLLVKTRIPMPGKAESLNAGIAAAIMMYEVAVRKTI